MKVLVLVINLALAYTAVPLLRRRRVLRSRRVLRRRRRRRRKRNMGMVVVVLGVAFSLSERVVPSTARSPPSPSAP